MKSFLAAILGLLLSFSAAQAFDSSAGKLKVTTMATGLSEPWAVDFLPDGTALITEIEGRLWRLSGEGRREISGIPEVYSRGQGGLLDVMVPRDFDQTGQLYLTYAKPQQGGAGTAVAQARLSPDLTRLTDWQVIFELTPGSSGGRHFGSRIVEDGDGMLYVTIGDRGDRPSAQDLGRENGSVIRIGRDGSVPQDNPFAGQSGAQPEIWSYGHRNPQGAALDPSGGLWVVEHGARGGDELNRVEKGANYGWPVISYGRHYSGAKIGEGTSKPGMAQPVHYWDPSIAPSGLMFYSGTLFPDWQGYGFTGSLKFGYIARLGGTPMTEVEQLRSLQTKRVRDIAEAPDGSIWFLSVGNGAAYRITPN